jgi:hypothetical protein
VNGAEIRRVRLDLHVSINDAADLIGVDPKFWVDSIELDDVDAEYAAAIIAALEALQAERIDRARAAEQRKPSRPPPGSVSADLVTATEWS